ncbi:carbohydrate-binding protein [Pedobacter hartonius]|uniref:Carbohydrate binding module (Family 6) n=1 Tax=Pedobacter hartonius TaxID=425514 RepID=A0A1H3WDK7_9SPHI|nr:hypothetical protein [Pedobacter hartonius]SDZ84422.1 hypothetical protein SAMN05443550_101180 [Pedobacter hartonius]
MAETVTSWMDTGDTFAELPPNLFGAEWKRLDKTQEVSFHVTAGADVYIAMETGNSKTGTAPGEYEDSKSFLRDNEGKQLEVYKKRYEKGSTVKFSAASGFGMPVILAIQPQSSLAPAFDLKTAVNYPAAAAFSNSKGVVKASLMGKERLKFMQDDGAFVEFTIAVGVADTYSLTVKYHNPSGRPLNAKLEVLAADGTVMKAPEILQFAQTKPGKWGYVTTDTGTMINAGRYKVRIWSVDAKDVSIDGLEVQ